MRYGNRRPRDTRPEYGGRNVARQRLDDHASPIGQAAIIGYRFDTHVLRIRAAPFDGPADTGTGQNGRQCRQYNDISDDTLHFSLPVNVPSHCKYNAFSRNAPSDPNGIRNAVPPEDGEDAAMRRNFRPDWHDVCIGRMDGKNEIHETPHPSRHSKF